MELAERGVVELVAADFIIPFFAIESLCRVIVKPTNSFDEWSTAVHGRCQLDGRSPRNLGPPLMETLFVKEHDRELLDLVRFYITMTGGAARKESESQPGPGYERPQPKTCFPRMDWKMGGAVGHDR